jgi:small-conductance mechanosensitive channel
MTPRDAQRRRQARRSTIAGVAGVVLIALGVILTLLEVGGDVVPTILALVGVASLVAGVAIGAQLIVDNARFRQGQSYYDDED